MGFSMKNWALSGMSAGDGILASGESATNTGVIDIAVANYDPTDSAVVSLSVYDKYANFKSYILASGEIQNNSTVYIDSKVFLNEGDYIYAESDESNVSILGTGIELT